MALTNPVTKPYHKPCTWQAMALLLGGGMALAGRITAQQLTSFYLYVDFVIAASLSVCDQWGAIMVRSLGPLPGADMLLCGHRSPAGCWIAFGRLQQKSGNLGRLELACT